MVFTAQDFSEQRFNTCAVISSPTTQFHCPWCRKKKILAYCSATHTLCRRKGFVIRSVARRQVELSSQGTVAGMLRENVTKKFLLQWKVGTHRRRANVRKTSLTNIE